MWIINQLIPGGPSEVPQKILWLIVSFLFFSILRHTVITKKSLIYAYNCNTNYMIALVCIMFCYDLLCMHHVYSSHNIT